jgi:hypothetical protein
MSGKLAKMQKFVTYDKKISEDEMYYVKQIGDEGNDCNLCQIGGILHYAGGKVRNLTQAVPTLMARLQTLPTGCSSGKVDNRSKRNI